MVNKLRERLSMIESRHHYLTYLIINRFTNEKFLQLEVMNILSSMKDVSDYLPEKPYDLSSGEKCDFWFKSNNTEFWLEIKMRPTNYKKKILHGKAITNGVDQIIEDINRLRRIKDRSSIKLVLFAFFPLYADSYKLFNSKHLSRIFGKIGREISMPDIRIQINDAFFEVYISIIE